MQRNIGETVNFSIRKVYHMISSPKANKNILVEIASSNVYKSYNKENLGVQDKT